MKTLIEYKLEMTAEDAAILAQAASILERRYLFNPDQPRLCSAEIVKDYLSCKLAGLEHEVFSVLFLDTQTNMIKYDEMFRGTIDRATVHIREVLKAAVLCNARGVILVHNHPTGDSRPSQADLRMTKAVTEALRMVDIEVMDHMIVGKEVFSFAEHNLIQ